MTVAARRRRCSTGPHQLIVKAEAEVAAGEFTIASGRQAFQPGGQRSRAGNDQRASSSRGELIVQQQERHAGDVVSMKVRKEHDVDCGDVETETFDRGQNGGTGIDENGASMTLHEDAAMPAAAAGEGIPVPNVVTLIGFIGIWCAILVDYGMALNRKLVNSPIARYRSKNRELVVMKFSVSGKRFFRRRCRH